MKKEETIQRNLFLVLIALLAAALSYAPLFLEISDRGVLMEELSAVGGAFDRLGIGFVHQHLSMFWKLSMVLIQCGTLAACLLLLWDNGADRMGMLMGAVVYTTCPALLYTQYDLQSLKASTAYMLLPMAAFFLLHGVRSQKLRIPAYLAGAALLIAVLPLFGTVSDYALAGENGEAGSIARYRIGQYLTVFSYQKGHPGPGIAVLATFVLCGYLLLVKGKKWKETWNKQERILMILSGIFFFLALEEIPGGLIRQALLGRGIPVAEGSVLVGMGSLCTMLFASKTYCCMIEDEEIRPWNIWIPVGIFLAGVGITLFLCREIFGINVIPVG